MVAVNGASTGSWEAVSSAIRAAGSHPSTLTVERNGQRLDLSVTPVEMVRPVSDGKGQYVRATDGSIATTRGGFVGISPSSELVPGSITEVPGIVGIPSARWGPRCFRCRNACGFGRNPGDRW